MVQPRKKGVILCIYFHGFYLELAMADAQEYAENAEDVAIEDNINKKTLRRLFLVY